MMIMMIMMMMMTTTKMMMIRIFVINMKRGPRNSNSHGLSISVTSLDTVIFS